MRAPAPLLALAALCACGGPAEAPGAGGSAGALAVAPPPECASRARGTLRTSAGDVALDAMWVDAGISSGAGGCLRGLTVDLRVPNGSCALTLRFERGRLAAAGLDARSCRGMAPWTRGFYAAGPAALAFDARPGAPGCAEAWTVTFSDRTLTLLRADDGEPISVGLGEVAIEAPLGGAAAPGESCERDDDEDEDEDEDR
jgi:hypothetical protein